MNYLKCLHRSLLPRINQHQPKALAHFQAKLKVQPQPVDWSRAVLEAEKVVGYPTSFLNLRWLLNDEMANVAQHLKRLIGTDHPLLKTARSILMNQLPQWGLIVLLVSKAVGLNPKNKFTETDKDIAAGILHSQRMLAELTEMIRTSNLIHRGLLNIYEINSETDDMNYGNKIALLIGDYLLSKSFYELALIKDQYMNELISSALRDLTEGEFFGPRDKQNKPLPCKPTTNNTTSKIDNEYCDSQSLNNEIPDVYTSKPINPDNYLGNSVSEWTLRHLLSGGTLLAKSCQGSLKLSGYEHDLEYSGYQFGKHLALAWQASLDLAEFQPGKYGQFSLTGAPLMCQLTQDGGELYGYVEAGSEDVGKVDYRYLRERISKGEGLKMTKGLIKKHTNAARNVLNSFGDSEARNALRNIVNAI